MDDFLQRLDARRAADEKRRQLRLRDLHEVGGVRAVIAADDEQQVHRLAQHFEERVLPFLGRAADRVEHLERGFVAIAVDDRLAQTRRWISSVSLFSMVVWLATPIF